MPLKVFSQHADVSLRRRIPTEDAEQEEEEEEMAASQVIVLPPVWGCVCFSSWNAWTENLQNFSSLLLSFLPGVLVITFLFFSFFFFFFFKEWKPALQVSSPSYSRAFSPLSVSWLSVEHDEFSTRNSDFQCWIHSLCERSIRGGTGIWESHWDVVQC